MTVISLHDVHKTYRSGQTKVTPLAGLELAIDEGEFVALMGPSGSGKSTILNLIAGIDRPTKGAVVVDGEEISSWSENRLADWRSESMGFIFQRFNLMPVLTAQENVELPLLLSSLSRSERRRQVQTALELVDLWDHRDHRPGQLSGGQQQRVAIARAVATDPKIILADEPTGNLDRETAEVIMDLLEELRWQLDKTVVLVTHDEIVARRADRVLRLDKGILLDEDEGQEEAPMGEP